MVQVAVTAVKEHISPMHGGGEDGDGDGDKDGDDKDEEDDDKKKKKKKGKDGKAKDDGPATAVGRAGAAYSTLAGLTGCEEMVEGAESLQHATDAYDNVSQKLTAAHKSGGTVNNVALGGALLSAYAGVEGDADTAEAVDTVVGHVDDVTEKLDATVKSKKVADGANLVGAVLKVGLDEDVVDEVVDEDDWKSVDDAMAALPAPWVAVRDEGSGKDFYFNPQTNVTTWERPKEEKKAAPAPASVVVAALAPIVAVAPAPALARVAAGASAPARIAAAVPAAAPAPAPEPSLPHGWTAVIDPGSQKPFYHNSSTGESTWDKPTPTAAPQPAPLPLPVPPAAVSASAVPAPWTAVEDPTTKQVFYHNSATGESRWQL
jgi:hypothetical protein